jgi:PadR family transcriptional regulator PadR
MAYRAHRPKMTRPTLEVLAVLLINPSEPVYGLQIAEATALKTGTVYPILARLEQAGWLTSEWEASDTDAKGPRKKFYRLTPTGLMEAQQAIDDRDAAVAHAKVKRTALGFGH